MRTLLTVLFALAAIAPASAADLKLLTAGAFKSVALELVPEFEKKTGHKVTVENDTAGAIARRIADGESFDVVVMPPAAMGPLLGSKLVESSAKPLARVGIGVAIKQGAPVPDISTVDAFKQSLLKARAIAYTDPASGGTAGTYLAKLFEKLGIAAELKPKSVLVKGGLAAEKLISGEADIAMQPASELLAVPGAVLVGPIPLEVQTYIIYAGAVSAGTRDQAGGRCPAPRPMGPRQGAAAEEEGDGAALAASRSMLDRGRAARAERSCLARRTGEKVSPLRARAPVATLRERPSKPSAPSPPPSTRRSCGRCRRGRGPGSHSTCSRPS